jgi:predicted TIM-barrel fold metal-dependent hydrolase
MTIIDAWIQHPTPTFIGDPMFESLRRWMGLSSIPSAIPIEFTLAALDAAKIDRALVTAWWGPQGPLLGNDEVAALTRAHPQRLFGVGSVDLRHPMAAVTEVVAIIQSTPRASSSGSPSARRSVTPAPCAAPSMVDQFPTLTTSRSISPT